MRVQFMKLLPAVIALSSAIAVASCSKPDEEPATAVAPADSIEEFSAEAMSSSTSSTATVIPGVPTDGSAAAS